MHFVHPTKTPWFFVDVWTALSTLPEINHSAFLVFMCSCDTLPQAQRHLGLGCVQVLLLLPTVHWLVQWQTSIIVHKCGWFFSPQRYSYVCLFKTLVKHCANTANREQTCLTDWQHVVSVQMIKATVGEEKGPSHDKPYEQKGVVNLFLR